MREIKFRIWNGESIEETTIDFNIDKDTKYKEFYIYPDDVFMQFTGLRDKNGVEIYEGDIVKTNLYNIKGYVYYSSPSFGIKQKNGVCIDYDWSNFNNFEVIGNIYENYELLRED